MADVFEDRPELVPWRLELFDLIRRTPNLDWLLLTKRPASPWLSHFFDGEPPTNVWLGTSVEDQATADLRIPKLLQIPAAVRFVSYEPALSYIDFRLLEMAPNGHDLLRWIYAPCPYGCGGDGCCGCDHLGTVQIKCGLDWIIVGGEYGPGHRPFGPEWARQTVADCKAAGVACFVKQDSGPKPGQQGRIPDEVWTVKEWPVVA
jgi:protein gp37